MLNDVKRMVAKATTVPARELATNADSAAGLGGV